MRYTEQLKYSWNYHWGVFREIWDMFTLHNWRWLVVGLLVVLCVLPVLVGILGHPKVQYYVNTPVPPFDPTLPQDIISPYFFIIRSAPSILEVVNYYWVKGSGFVPLSNVLCIISMGLLLGAYLRGK